MQTVTKKKQNLFSQKKKQRKETFKSAQRNIENYPNKKEIEKLISKSLSK